MSLIKENAVSVWLKADLDTLVTRCMKRNTRPLLRTGDPKEILGNLMQQRYPVYGEADITVESSHGPHEVVVNKIVSALKNQKVKEENAS